MIGTVLGKKMRQLARDKHPRAEELREKAAAFDQAVKGYYEDDPPTVDAKAFLAAFARARKLWSVCSGEPLV